VATYTPCCGAAPGRPASSWPSPALYAVHALSPSPTLQGQIRPGTCALLLARSVLPRRNQQTATGKSPMPDAPSLGAS